MPRSIKSLLRLTGFAVAPKIGDSSVPTLPKVKPIPKLREGHPARAIWARFYLPPLQAFADDKPQTRILNLDCREDRDFAQEMATNYPAINTLVPTFFKNHP